ncbi:hypothetical protein U9R90_35640 [Streptomyces sp. E11-3]|uniref:hypothetical protein n=1 Tax=Streptomyces sp. E11-3 TaxID=3110112 RepID=UPI00397FA316
MKSTVSRAVVAVSVVAALGFTAACGGSDSGSGDEGKDKPSAEKTTEAAKPEGGAKALTAAQLKAAIIAQDDVTGYKVEELPEAEWPTKSIPASADACQPIADMVMFSTQTKAKSRIGRTVAEKKLASITSVALLAHEQADAEKDLDALRTAVEKCEKFDHEDSSYTGVKAQPDPKLGDESVAYHLIGDIEGEETVMSFTVVRSGSTLVPFYTMNVVATGKTETPAAIIDAQLAKLEKAAG